MEALLDVARQEARKAAAQMMARANTEEESVAALRALSAMTEELVRCVTEGVAELEAKRHTENGGELH